MLTVYLVGIINLSENTLYHVYKIYNINENNSYKNGGLATVGVFPDSHNSCIKGSGDPYWNI
ncbi:MAG: hypothetical protein R2788_02360 [Saprospiraceae bacterium]